MKKYRLNKIFGYQKARVYMITSIRGIGKTTNAMEWALKDWLRNKKQFIYLRRNTTELPLLHTLFDNLYALAGNSASAEKFAWVKNIEIDYRGGVFYGRLKNKENEETTENQEYELDSEVKKTPRKHVKGKIGWEIMGYAFALAKQQDIKSNPFPDVN